MSSLLPLRTVTARVTLALALVVPAASAAIAQQNTTALQQMYHTGQNDDFGAQDDLSISAARSVSAAPLTPADRATLQSEYQQGEENAFTPGVTGPALTAQRRDDRSPLASNAPMVGGKPDLVGARGPQDTFADQIYQPGSRLSGW
ncbi:MAG TPA: hypothetical protein VMA53_13960 [Stellaceae bacterium]|nr:hypothetical protein [Stellaceae bacterium]